MSMRAKFLREVASAGLPSGPPPTDPLIEADVEALPATVQRYLRHMGVLGRPRDWSFRGHFTGRFRPGIDKPWLACETQQYNTRLEIARIFHIRVRFVGFVPVLARDTYVRGRGRMLVRLVDLFTLADATGPELDIGELVTYLNDAVLMAPSLLLGPETRWTAVDDASFDVALTDGGRTVSARVFLDERGAPVDFSTTDRFCEDPANPKGPMLRTRWTTPMQGWRRVEGRLLPTRGEAIWHLPSGPHPYAEFDLAPESLRYNLRPGE
ncbi:MAG: hypothetical protein JRI25_23865 [Deltaproteobacteria bacterium]|nr:hypothetical protein [Deltaproteobacteria bacterium]